jgi:hypothetical protein
MMRPPRLAFAAAAAALVLLAGGCGSTPAHGPRPAGAAPVPVSPLDTSLTTAAGTWATVDMGRSAAQYENFWQLLIRPAGATRWSLVTPPGTADNGGLVLAAGTGPAAITAFRPSQLLTYTPLSETARSGRAWTAISPLDAPLASTPAAIAEQPASGRLLALTTTGTAEEAGRSSADWRILASTRTIAATAAGRHCGLRALTAVAWTPLAGPLLAGRCARPGTAGVFAYESGTWRATGPALPPSLAGEAVTVLRLTTTQDQTAALLAVGSGRSASLVAAWSGRADGPWTLSAPLPLGRGALASASSGPDSTITVITAAGTGALTAAGEGTWRMLPALPPGTVTLAAGAGGLVEALAVHAATLTVWQLTRAGTTWSRSQVISVPIQYGSSG